MTDQELSRWLDAAREAARRGAAVLEDWRHQFSVQEKARFDLVTEADLASQKAIQEYLHYHFPDHAFLGEEATTLQSEIRNPKSENDRGETSDFGFRASALQPTWIVDPLDGTTNYVHDCPMYCVSIGLLVQGEIVVGVVYDPTRQEMFYAAAGQGAWLKKDEGGRMKDESQAKRSDSSFILHPSSFRLQTSRTDRLEESLLATGFPPDLRGQERALDWWRYFSLRAQSLRRTGSTALNLVYVAAGRFDGYWGFDNHAWDVAGAAVIIREAGGQITTADGQPFDPFRPDTLASNGPLHPVLLQALKQMS